MSSFLAPLVLNVDVSKAVDETAQGYVHFIKLHIHPSYNQSGNTRVTKSYHWLGLVKLSLLKCSNRAPCTPLFNVLMSTVFWDYSGIGILRICSNRVFLGDLFRFQNESNYILFILLPITDWTEWTKYGLFGKTFSGKIVRSPPSPWRGTRSQLQVLGQDFSVRCSQVTSAESIPFSDNMRFVGKPYSSYFLICKTELE